jgi:hypothetical protein
MQRSCSAHAPESSKPRIASGMQERKSKKGTIKIQINWLERRRNGRQVAWRLKLDHKVPDK